MFYYKPFNNRIDGSFVRASKAWYTDDAGLVYEVATDVRRIVERAGDPWIWMEGARVNLITDPLDLSTAAWSPAVTGSLELVTTPRGDDELLVYAGVGDSPTQQFLVGAENVLVTASVYARDSPTEAGSGSADVGITNGNPNTDTTINAPVGTWNRGQHKAIDLAGAGNKSITFSSISHELFLWGVCVEKCFDSGAPTNNARFASQPILETMTRHKDVYLPGAITAAMVAQGPRRIRARFEPEFSSADVVEFDAFVVFSNDTEDFDTTLVLWLEGTGPGAVRARCQHFVGPSVASGSITFSPGQQLTLEVVLATGELIVSGATTGNGTFASGSYELTEGAAAYGCLNDGTAHAYALMAPFEIGYDDVTVTGIEQLTLNSARVTFSDNVLQFDPNGITDALNPTHYDISGTPGLPRVQSVGRGATNAEVILYFDAPIDGGALCRVFVHDIVASLIPIEVVETTVSFIAFGDEVSPAIAAELAIQRVDIANPQTPYDAGTSTLGTIPVTDAGDLENDSGRTGLRKRIYRRLSTVRDGFFHLDGYGLRPQDKSPITPTSLRQLQLNIEEQVLAEQGVVAVRVRMSEIAIGVVAVRLTVQDDNGAFEMTGTLDFTGE